MKKLLMLLLLMAIISYSSKFLMAQWIQTDGPEGGEIRCFASIDTVLFVGTEIGVFRSMDNGISWSLTGPENRMVLSLAVKSSGESGMNLFAGTSLGGVYLSTDCGTSWNQVNFGLGYVSVIALAVSDTNLFAGTEDGVFLSPTDGTYWIPVNTGLANKSINSLTVSGVNLYAGTHGGVFCSMNNGSSWTPAGLTSEIVNAIAVIDTNLFAATDTNGVHRSTDNGLNWEFISNPEMDWNVKALAVSNNNLFVGTHRGIYLTPTYGTYWIPVMTGLASTDVDALYVRGTDLFAGTYGGVFHSKNNGAKWTEVNAGLKATFISALITSGENLYAGTSADIYCLNFGSNNWISLGSNTWVNSIAVSGENIYGGSWGHLVYSTNNGANWNYLGIQKNSDRIFSLAILDSYIFAGSESAGVFRIKSNGPGLFTIDSTGQPDTVVHCLAVKGPNLFAGTAKGIYLSSDNGLDWTSVNYGLTNLDINALAVKDSNLFAGTSGGGVFLSTNDGISWNPVNTGLTDQHVTSFAVSDTNLFAGTRSGVFISTNNGASWRAENTGLTNLKINATTNIISLAIAGTNLYAGTGGTGVWKRPLSEMITSVEGVSSEPLLKFSLEQNYPNPFNSETTFRYHLSETSYVGISIYNEMGQLVCTLVDDNKESGYHIIRWDGRNNHGNFLGTGIYFAIFKTDEFMDVKKVLLIR